jgi:hypothetical protein
MIKQLIEKLHEYNKENSTAWAVLICTPNTEEVFFVEEENNSKCPYWWPNSKEALPIKEAIELIPKKKKYYLQLIEEGMQTPEKVFTDLSMEQCKRLLEYSEIYL